MKMVIAVVRTDSTDKIIESLKKIGVRGASFAAVNGVGDQTPFKQHYVIHTRIEIIAPDDEVIGISNVILEHAHTGKQGDGMIAVLPVANMLKIRTKERIS